MSSVNYRVLEHLLTGAAVSDIQRVKSSDQSLKAKWFRSPDFLMKIHHSHLALLLQFSSALSFTDLLHH